MPSNRGLTKVDIEIANNVFWVDAFQFGMPEDQTWNFIGKSFLLDVKNNANNTTPMLACSSMGGTIVVDDVNQRILSMFVTDAVLRATLPVGSYVYDLIMVDNSTGERDGLMYGDLKVVQGVTGED